MRTPSLLLAFTAVALTACGGMKNPLQRTLPDETQVLAGPSLSLPPSYELRPPREGEASETMLRGPASQPVSGSGAESWLVNQAQTQAGTVRDENIRTDLEAKAAEDKAAQAAEAEKKGLLQRWFGK
ncbi:MAG: hypothetical protein INF43_00520 [Alphaproteobacteria bacterium]|jgi:hypothetical protein|nr:hypothetical protein [Alphaproteobacteria bacterium]